MFEKDTANGVIALDLAHHERSSLLEKTLNIQEQSKTKNQNKKAKKKIPMRMEKNFMRLERWLLMFLKVEYFQLKTQSKS